MLKTFAINNDIISYPLVLEQKLMAFCEQQLLQHLTPDIYFPCNCYD